MEITHFYCPYCGYGMPGLIPEPGSRQVIVNPHGPHWSLDGQENKEIDDLNKYAESVGRICGAVVAGLVSGQMFMRLLNMHWPASLFGWFSYGAAWGISLFVLLVVVFFCGLIGAAIANRVAEHWRTKIRNAYYTRRQAVESEGVAAKS